MPSVVGFDMLIEITPLNSVPEPDIAWCPAFSKCALHH